MEQGTLTHKLTFNEPEKNNECEQKESKLRLNPDVWIRKKTLGVIFHTKKKW